MAQFGRVIGAYLGLPDDDKPTKEDIELLNTHVGSALPYSASVPIIV